MPEKCFRGHSTQHPDDRLPSGQCRRCDKINRDRYRRRQRAGAALLAAIENRGMSVGDVLAIVENVHLFDYWAIQAAQTRARRGPNA